MYVQDTRVRVSWWPRDDIGPVEADTQMSTSLANEYSLYMVRAASTLPRDATRLILVRMFSSWRRNSFSMSEKSLIVLQLASPADLHST